MTKAKRSWIVFSGVIVAIYFAAILVVACRHNTNLMQAENAAAGHEQVVEEETASPVENIAHDDIFEAIKAGDLGRTRQLMDADLTIVNVRDQFGHTPLHWAVWQKQDRNMTTLLLDKQAEINARCSSRGATALHWAAEGYDREIVELLIARGADVHAKDKDGRSVLQWAVNYLRKDMMELLLVKGADVNASDQVGWTPLHWIPLTAREGINHSPTDKDYANRKAIMGLLLDYGAEINARDASGASPLHIAAREAQTDVAEFYLRRGAKVDAKDESGLTALDYARQWSERTLKAISNEDARVKVKQRYDKVTGLLKQTPSEKE